MSVSVKAIFDKASKVKNFMNNLNKVKSIDLEKLTPEQKEQLLKELIEAKKEDEVVENVLEDVVYTFNTMKSKMRLVTSGNAMFDKSVYEGAKETIKLIEDYVRAYDRYEKEIGLDKIINGEV